MSKRLALSVIAALALAGCAKQLPPLPTTCGDALREQQVSALVCAHGCARAEAERSMVVAALKDDLCKRQARQEEQAYPGEDSPTDPPGTRAHREQLRAEADRVFDQQHPDKPDAGMNAIMDRIQARQQFEDDYMKQHSR